jgi:hypothetical protein
MKALLNMVKVTITKLIVPCSLLAALLVFLPSSLQARVTGVCSNCHTMHNSQNGQPMATYGGTTEAQGCLLRGTCLGCHGQNSSGTQNIIPLGNVPQVLLSTSATALAGGNFKYLDDDNDNRGHNVGDLGVAYKEDTAAMFPPPGNEFTENNVIRNSANFTCAGTKGCHGYRTIEDELLAIKGAHHTDDTILKFGIGFTETGQGDTPGLSYRFLLGVKGGEDIDWEATNSVTVHNEYKGATAGVEGGDAYTPGGNTISGFCAECHGNFHGGSADIGGPIGTPWLRHPTDISLPLSGEYILYTTYSLTAPVARTTIPNSPSSTVTPSGNTDDISMCLSCHRAHASPYFKIMRWDYKSSTLSTALAGCNVCHTSKN